MIRFSEFRTLLKKKYPYMFYLRQSDTYNLNPIRTLPFLKHFLIIVKKVRSTRFGLKLFGLG